MKISSGGPGLGEESWWPSREVSRPPEAENHLVSGAPQEMPQRRSSELKQTGAGVDVGAERHGRRCWRRAAAVGQDGEASQRNTEKSLERINSSVS